MIYEPLTGAIALAWRSDVMLVVAMALIWGASALGTAARQRALKPEFQWRQALTSHVLIENDSEQGARRASSLVSVALLGSIGAAALFLSGHVPVPLLAITPAALAVLIATLLVVRIWRASGPRSVLKERGSRLIASSLFAEVSVAFAVVVTVVVVVHTEGLTAVSVLEIVAISFASRLAMRLTPWPAGIGIADAALLIPLTWIGVPLHVALSAVLIWRCSSLLAATAAFVVVRRTLHARGPGEYLRHNDSGRLFHRALFFSISLLPVTVRDACRRRIFDSLFTHSEDPWDYQSSAYEYSKRDHLIAAIPAEARWLAEVGCADGHNLIALAQSRPEMTLIGLEVSSTAAAIASCSAEKMANVHILGPKNISLLQELSPDGLDCIVLSEVLYYMGSETSMRKSLLSVRESMNPDCVVIMLHGASDATVLHKRAMHAMNLIVEQEIQVDDEFRPFKITVARNASVNSHAK